ncbi:MAG: PHP domain-containing protein [Firmicutes bacterium]|nr:PHP domain-containing protein [Bacillota bacterium]
MIDLHTHSNFSDGSETPESIIETAKKIGLSAIALTDHDTFDGLERAATKAEELGVPLIPGCEVSSLYNQNTSVHVLCYFVSDSKSPLGLYLATLRQDRISRNERLVTRLNELGADISLDEVEKEAGGGLIGRPHFAQVLVNRKIAGSLENAFNVWLGNKGKAYIPKERTELRELVSAVKLSGGVTSLAHPLSGSFSFDQLEQNLIPLRELGIVGIECHYGKYSPGTRLKLAALAEQYGFIPTGGSDFHGKYKPELSIGTGEGDLAIADGVLEKLIAAKPEL